MTSQFSNRALPKPVKRAQKKKHKYRDLSYEITKTVNSVFTYDPITHIKNLSSTTQPVKIIKLNLIVFCCSGGAIMMSSGLSPKGYRFLALLQKEVWGLTDMGI